ncbi:MAG: hypothetical protein ACI85O_003490, partial [Saprospiraceae bacterium]
TFCPYFALKKTLCSEAISGFQSPNYEQNFSLKILNLFLPRS